jgi:hypothetical protein
MLAAIDNPLDSAANSAKHLGGAISELLRGTARWLEQATGDAFTAAVVAALLMFALSLLKGGAIARNTKIYAYGLICMGAAGVIGLLIITAWNIHDLDRNHKSITHTSAADESTYRDALQIGLGTKKHDSVTARFETEFPAHDVSFIGILHAKYRFYFLIFSVMIFVGAVISAISRFSGRPHNV